MSEFWLYASVRLCTPLYASVRRAKARVEALAREGARTAVLAPARVPSDNFLNGSPHPSTLS